MDRLMDLTDGDGDATKIDQDETEITGLVPTGDWIGQARIAPLPPAAAPQHPALTLGEGGEEGLRGWGCGLRFVCMWLDLSLCPPRSAGADLWWKKTEPAATTNTLNIHLCPFWAQICPSHLV